MGIFDTFKGKKEEEKKSESKPAVSSESKKAEKVEKKKEEKTAEIQKKKNSSELEKPKKAAKARKTAKKEENAAHSVLIAPIISEKTTAFGLFNKYVFKVRPEAGKYDVKSAIEDYYGVSVTKVNIVKIHPKKRIHGRTIGWKQGFKKAIVTLQAGDTIGIVEGV